VEVLLDAGVLSFLRRHGAIVRGRGYEHERARRIVAGRNRFFELDVPIPSPLVP
jgi:hypothetical protein